jgi:hypothetical protein
MTATCPANGGFAGNADFVKKGILPEIIILFCIGRIVHPRFAFKRVPDWGVYGAARSGI